MKKLFVLWMLLQNLSLFALSDGSQWIYTGISPSGNGMAYGGVAGLNYSGGLFYNPANPAFVHRFRLFGQLGIGESEPLMDLGMSLPLPTGTLSAAFRSLSVGGANGIGGVMDLRVGHSKMITENFAFGFNGILFNQVGSTGQSALGLSFDIGAVFLFNKSLSNRAGIGIYDPRLGVALTGIGIPATVDPTTPLPGIGLRFGASADILRSKLITIAGGIDGIADIYPGIFALQTGLKISMAQHFHLSGGYILGTSDLTGSQALSPWTLGASFSWEFGETPVEIFYSFNPTSFGGNVGAVHFIGAEIAFGLPDTQGPKTLIKIKGSSNGVAWFSPNYDGVKDRADIKLKIADASLIRDWTLTVFDAKWNKVRTIKGVKGRETALTLPLFWKKLWAKKQGVKVPAEIEWDGTSDQGYILPDGLYRVILFSEDDLKNKAQSATNTIILDRTPPMADLNVDNKVFSPNNDGQRDQIRIRQTLSEGDFWKAEIRDQKQQVMRIWDWKNNPPKTLIWDGKNQNGKVLPDGLYNYVVMGEDLAGNRQIAAIQGIQINTQAHSAILEINYRAFSPNDNGIKDSVTFKPIFSDPAQLSSWSLRIKQNNKIVREWKGEKTPPVITWNGHNNNGKLLIDGNYNISLTGHYLNGDMAHAPDTIIRVDTHAPSVSYQTAPKLFSPDGDGDNDLLEIRLKLKDPDGISRWKLEIIDPDGLVFKTFSGKGEPAPRIFWDGRSDTGLPVESAQSYRVRLNAADTVGNRIVNKELSPIHVDVLVEATARGLKIRINNIEFEFGKATIKGQGFHILDRVAQILKKYKQYQVDIQGHTDNIGTKEANLRLSKDRADAVKQYLISKGISPPRMRTEGLAFKYPIADNSTEAGRRKNRRVEFILIKSR